MHEGLGGAPEGRPAHGYGAVIEMTASVGPPGGWRDRPTPAGRACQRYLAQSSSSPCIVMPNQETPPLQSAPGFCVGSAVICSRTAQQTRPNSRATATTRVRAAHRFSRNALTTPAAATVTMAQVRTLEAA